ncbi:hypothetical protein DL96DRAFT_1581130 [Flagelloscypha sp. PMI_526]|nr:hypothetical protein DL96DRAFT_1581130 [Flagelloscypha sp. PMI_526]
MSLPLDLLPLILGYLDRQDLEKCCRVTVAFRHIARPLLFSHVILWSSTWKAKCSFLLGETSERRLSHIKKVTIRIDGIPGLTKEGKFQPLIQSFLRTVGPQLDAFCIHADSDRHWKKLHPSFRNDICDTILPHIHTFELVKIVQIRLLTVLSHCPKLQVLRLGSTDYVIGKSEDEIKKEDLVELGLPRMTSLVMDDFGREDLRGSTSLARYLVFRGNEIRNLTLSRYCEEDFALALDFLIPFDELRNSLLHIFFGTHLYETVVRRPLPELDLLGLGIFPRVQTITFTAPVDASPGEWDHWWTYIAQTLDQPEIVDCIRSLKTMKMVLQSRNPPDDKPLSVINELTSKVDFEIHIMGSGISVAQNFSEIARAFRTCLPSWDQAGKLKFWVTD